MDYTTYYLCLLNSLHQKQNSLCATVCGGVCVCEHSFTLRYTHNVRRGEENGVVRYIAQCLSVFPKERKTKSSSSNSHGDIAGVLRFFSQEVIPFFLSINSLEEIT